MTCFSKTIKISRKGQITIPKEIRDRLAEDVIKVVSDDDGVRLEPVRSVAGALHKYAKNYTGSWEKGRDRAWFEETKRLVPHGRRRP